MNEYKVGCIADLISQGKSLTKKVKKSVVESHEVEDDVTPKKRKKSSKSLIVDTKPSNVSVNESDGKKKKHKNKKNKQKTDSVEVESKKINGFSQPTESDLNLSSVVEDKPNKKKKKKHKHKDNSVNISSNESNNLIKPIAEINNGSDIITDSLVKKNKKKKQKNKSHLPDAQKTDYINLKKVNVKGAEQKAINCSSKVKSLKRKKSEIQNENAEDSESVAKPKKKKNAILDLDHVPTDSEEENEKEKNEKPIIKKKENQYKDFTENTVFIGNIPIKYDKHKVHKIFSKFGKIKSARIRCVPISNLNISKKVAAVTKDFNPKRNSLVAYVKYETKEGAVAALQANGMVIEGHHIRVDLADNKQERDNNKAVFVGGLPFDIEDDELWEFFEKCGKIMSVRVVRDSHTSMGKGFGYVNFESTASVELALQLNGELLKKRAINVKRCVKSRNKNKMNAFGKKKSKEMANQLMAKKGKKLKAEKKKEKLHNNPVSGDFQGKKANIKEKKKKKPSKTELRKRKIVKILGFSEK